VCLHGGFATLETAELATFWKAHLRETEDGARALEAFLASVERKAFRIAQIGLRHEADALDVVQDAMLQLSARYASRPAENGSRFLPHPGESHPGCAASPYRANRVMALMPWHAATSRTKGAGDP